MSTRLLLRSIRTEKVMESSETEESSSSSLDFYQARPNITPAREKSKVKFQGKDRYIKRPKKSPTKKTLEECWYTKEEIASFRKRDGRYIQDLITSGLTSLTGEDDTDAVSLVGLLSERDCFQRLKRIRAAKLCVTKEQLSQEKKYFKIHSNLESFELQHEKISHVYASQSKRSATIALLSGMAVSLHVKGLWEEDKGQDSQESTTDDADGMLNKETKKTSCCSDEPTCATTTSKPSIIPPTTSKSRRSRYSSLRTVKGRLFSHFSWTTPAA